MRRTFVVLLSLLLPVALWAAEQTVVLDVNGNCRMCKKRIEKASNAVEGVIESDWDRKEHKLTVKFDDTKTTKDKIVSSVLAAGYDADGKKATDESYEALPDCCKYRV